MQTEKSLDNLYAEWKKSADEIFDLTSKGHLNEFEIAELNKLDNYHRCLSSMITNIELEGTFERWNPYPKYLAPNIKLDYFGDFNRKKAYDLWLAGEQWSSFRDEQCKAHPRCYYCKKKSRTFHHQSYYKIYVNGNWVNDWLNPYSGVAVCNDCHQKIHNEQENRRKVFEVYDDELR